MVHKLFPRLACEKIFLSLHWIPSLFFFLEYNNIICKTFVVEYTILINLTSILINLQNYSLVNKDRMTFRILRSQFFYEYPQRL